MTSTPPAPRLADLRERWLSAVIAALQGDAKVAGVALVGSLGAGRADDWSDVDLLVVVEDLDDYAVPGRLPQGPGRLAFEIDARHNGPRGTRAISAQYVVEDLPLWVDWHLHPVSLANWPSDSSVIFDRRGIAPTPATLSEYLNRGEHEPATPKTDDEHDAMRLALIPIAAKQVARQSPDAARTIEYLGGDHTADQLSALDELLNQFEHLGRADSLAAGRAYVELLRGAIR
ncbi:nucleotidyltransferase domain-containing protein [Kribbella sp. NPDC051586]|uniref:nucleotidyltransferase domain-containing protein n=1 Tax=Kribbella sp. NPDC051586 TaxID=3364118 RepID=UPI0037BB002B